MDYNQFKMKCDELLQIARDSGFKCSNCARSISDEKETICYEFDCFVKHDEVCLLYFPKRSSDADR